MIHRNRRREGATPPLYIGTGRALVRLDSGECIAVDTRSIDAVPYLLGSPHEGHAVFAFRCLLQPDSVVVDVGANFGLYSAVTTAALGERGRLYAFEGNPRTFEFLVWTIYANNGFRLTSNLKPVNLLVSDRTGRGTLHYLENALGGGTMTRPSPGLLEHFAQFGQAARTVEIGMTTIDDYLPPDLAVDFVKMDIEGHEPFALRGMRRTIARSPNLRCLIEFNDRFLEHTVPGPEFLDEIHALGFRVCRIMPDSRLQPVPGGTPLRGHFELLLTRSPEDDAAIIEARLGRRGRLKKWWRDWTGAAPARRHSR